jgi:nitroreductase
MNVMTPNPRLADHPVDPMFLQRHSSRAFAGDAMGEAELLALLEAARWAPSGSNVQPARYAWGLRGDAGFDAIAQTLAPGNRLWAEKAAALVVVASKAVVDKDGAAVPHPSHAFDAGAAWMSLALQAHLSGWVAHAMGGFDKDKAALALALPPDHVLHVVVAIGRKGDAALLPEPLRTRDVPNGRLPLAQIARRGAFPAGLS